MLVALGMQRGEAMSLYKRQRLVMEIALGELHGGEWTFGDDFHPNMGWKRFPNIGFMCAWMAPKPAN